MKICEKKCDECLFTKNRLVSFERAKELILECLENDQYFICHKSTLKWGTVCCKWFFDKHKRDVLPIRLATSLNILEFVNTDDEPIVTNEEED